MKYTNTVLEGIGIYHPKNKIGNDFFINHFKENGENAEKLMLKLGRKQRYLVKDSKENALTMAVDASKAALDNAGIEPDALDMIVFVSETPEYLVPTNALILRNKIGACNANIVYDMNANCIGMINSLDSTCRYIKNNSKVKYALIVGSLFISSMVRKDCIVTYPNIADGSAAIIIKNTEESYINGFIDSEYHTDSTRYDLIMSPGCGISNILDSEIEEGQKKLCWVPHEVDYFSTEWKKIIVNMLNRNDLVPDDIDQYFFSQFSKPDAEATLLKLEVGLDKQTFVGEKYGYTGCASPFFALNDAIEQNRVKKGSLVVFCSVGAGYSMSTVLFKI